MKFEYKDISEERLKELDKVGINNMYIPEFERYNPCAGNLSSNFCSENEEYIIVKHYGGSIPYRVGLKYFPYLFIYQNNYVILFITVEQDIKKRFRDFYIEKNKKIEENERRYQLLGIIKDAIIASEFDPHLTKEQEYLNDFTFKVFYNKKEILS